MLVVKCKIIFVQFVNIKNCTVGIGPESVKGGNGSNQFENA